MNKPQLVFINDIKFNPENIAYQDAIIALKAVASIRDHYCGYGAVTEKVYVTYDPIATFLKAFFKDLVDEVNHEIVRLKGPSGIVTEDNIIISYAASEVRSGTLSFAVGLLGEMSGSYPEKSKL